MKQALDFWDPYTAAIRAEHSSDASWARAMVHVFNPPREQPPAKPTAMDSHPTPARIQPVGGMSDGDDATGFFTSSSPLSSEAATTAPPRRIDALARFSARGTTRRSPGRPCASGRTRPAARRAREAGGELSALRLGPPAVEDPDAAFRRRFRCTSIRKSPCADGTEIWEPEYR
jgi:hypothetical protein